MADDRFLLAALKTKRVLLAARFSAATRPLAPCTFGTQNGQDAAFEIEILDPEVQRFRDAQPATVKQASGYLL
jgi:hypothetical protein